MLQECWSYYLCHVSVFIIIIMVLFSISTRWLFFSVVTKRFLFGIVEYIDLINIYHISCVSVAALAEYHLFKEKQLKKRVEE